MPATIYTRATDVLWRVAPDRVLVRRLGHDGVELLGLAALIWIALDEQRTFVALEDELSGLVDGVVDVAETLEPLVADGLVDAREGQA